jgi:hypothetical protein
VGAGTPRPFLPRAVYDGRVSLAAGLPAPYTVAMKDRTIQPERQRRIARERLGLDPIEIAGGHCPNVSPPDTFAEILIDVA